MIPRPEIPPRQVARAWAPAIAFMALIWALSSFELTGLPLRDLPLGDKGVHFLEHGLLGFLVAHAAIRTWPSRHPVRTLALAVFVTALFGLLDEIHQAFVPGRSSELLDLLADSVGAIFGALARRSVELARGRLVESET